MVAARAASGASCGSGGSCYSSGSQDAYEAQQRWQQKQELDRECNALLDQKAILQAECQRFFEQKTELEQEIMKASTMMTQLTENLTRLKKQVQESDGAKDIRGMEVVMLQIQEQELRDNIEHLENQRHGLSLEVGDLIQQKAEVDNTNILNAEPITPTDPCDHAMKDGDEVDICHS